MLFVLFFGYWAVLLAVTAFAFLRGGSAERWAAGMIFIGSLFTPLARHLFNTNWRAPQAGILFIDVFLLAGFLLLALTSRRFWPMTTLCFQAMAVMTHPAIMIDRDILPFGYALMQGFWAYPMLATIVVGTLRHQRRARQTVQASFGSSPSSVPETLH